MELRQQLQQYRKAAGFSQEELAERLMVTQATISKVENGMRFPDRDLLVDWAYVCTQKPVKFIYERGTDGSRMTLTTV